MKKSNPKPQASRRQFLTGMAGVAAATTLPSVGSASKPVPKQKQPNILWIMSDDMAAELSCYGSLARAKTPNLDRLASEGVRFDRNYCQFPLCNPSRASLFNGRKPTTTGVLGNRTDFRTAHPDWVSLPQFFREHGYDTYRTGKIFHGGIDDPKAWNEVGFNEQQPFVPPFTAEHTMHIPAEPVPPPPPGIPGPPTTPPAPSADPDHSASSDRIVVVENDGTGHPENHSADLAIDYLRKHRHGQKPFFLAVGFSRPHSPPTAPQKFIDLYDLDKIELPVNFAPWPTVTPDIPAAAIRKQNADLFIRRGASEREAKEVTRAYLASITWADWNIGRVLEELDHSELRENTIVVFVADHGYQLGERGKWSKAGSLFELGTRVPLLIRAPGAAGNGRASYRTVESLDLYPTLVELAGFARPDGLEGESLAPLLKQPDSTWDRPAFSIWSEDGKTIHGTAVRTERYRYVEFGAAGEGAKHGAMLFDERADPLELVNLAEHPDHAETRRALSAKIARYNAS
ncbi:sulfatase-like hydrolase/transferase [Granulicella paludicola]|uniref:sulfatase-like hydrolase/transferase n=1 Tax=Granulicella paludicola TaxID=474951 RepID=UPI0021E0EC2B|nr:sulfatase-like hydrolase/transferase [Granulicella paludicola]